ncbi:MAG: MBL fold metallo-hydrolase [Solirubrobacterales bacterium]|nr:MBL fold metallo-hydrolase [Solirubrobacterales bacterium]
MPGPVTARAEHRVTWLGHSTVLLELDGARVLTDPVLRPRVAHLRRHGPAPAAVGRLDAVLISHLHHDHLDLPSLRMLDAATPVVVPRGSGRTFALRSLRRELVELGEGEEASFDGARVRAVRAVHDDRRLPLTSRTGALGFVVEGAGRRVYFAGDTEVFDGMRAIGGDGLDVALLPVWGWGTRLGPGHMDPDQAAQAAALLRPALAIPVHWGTYLPYGAAGRHSRVLEVPGTTFAERVRVRAPGVRVVVLQPGDWLAL